MLSQVELARRAGMTPKAISALERGARQRPYPSTVRAIALAFDLNEAQTAELFAAADGGGVSDPRDPPGPTETAVVVQLPNGRPVPSPAAPVVGRAEVIEFVTAILRAREYRIVTITGAGGVGKSTVAKLVAQASGQAFPDGIAFVDSARLDAPRDLLASIASDLGLGPYSGEVTTLARRLGDRRLLLVLDTVEHLLGCAPALAELSALCPGLSILATSRAALRIRAEYLVRVAPLSSDDTARLFCGRMRAYGSDARGDTLGGVSVDDLARRTGGLPLAVELLALALGRLRVTEPSSRWDELASPFLRDLPRHQRSMRATVDWSLSLLTATARDLAVRLTVLSDDFSLATARTICASDAPDPASDVSELLDHHLIAPSRFIGGVPRFGILAPVRKELSEHRGAEQGRDVLARLGVGCPASRLCAVRTCRGSGWASAVRALSSG